MGLCPPATSPHLAVRRPFVHEAAAAAARLARHGGEWPQLAPLSLLQFSEGTHRRGQFNSTNTGGSSQCVRCVRVVSHPPPCLCVLSCCVAMGSVESAEEAAKANQEVADLLVELSDKNAEVHAVALRYGRARVEH